MAAKSVEQTKQTRAVSNREADNLWQMVRKAQPALTATQMLKAIERFVPVGDGGRWARLALITLSWPGKYLQDKIAAHDDTAQLYADAQLQITNEIAAAKQYIKLLEMAQARIAVSLCGRADMDALIENANGTH